MKNLHFSRWALALGALIALGGSVTSVIPANAAAYHTVNTQKIKKTAYHKKSTKGALYNQAHNRKVANLKTYPNTTWYVTKQATLKHGNSKGIYYYAANKSGAVKGWIWHGYLTKGKAPFGLKYAKGAVALDAQTGKTVWSKAGNTARPIASTTKLMSPYLTLQ